MTANVNTSPQSNDPQLKEGSVNNYTYRMHEISVGLFFILAAVTSFIELGLYQPILDTPEYVITGTSNNQIILGAVFEFLLAVCCVGIATSMYPYLKAYNESIGFAHGLIDIQKEFLRDTSQNVLYLTADGISEYSSLKTILNSLMNS